jgi:hypothetical protein
LLKKKSEEPSDVGHLRDPEVIRGGSLGTSIYSNQRILAQSPAGGHHLYVAITRATHRRTVVREGDLPAPLHRLAS